ncbi:MAG: hypothetical protein M3N38_02095 [Pseudomonadota bacterium]|nr:hypothetical protein [Pseudomonadota bacterium]
MPAKELVKKSRRALNTPSVTPAKAGVQLLSAAQLASGIAAFAAMTVGGSSSSRQHEISSQARKPASSWQRLSSAEVQSRIPACAGMTAVEIVLDLRMSLAACAKRDV